MMSGIRSKNTRPELTLRRGLFARGFRFRLHDPRLPGKPDLVLARYRAVIQVNGCFWHQHECPLFKWPTTRVDFWRAKIRRNKENDLRNAQRLVEDGWRVLIVWECALKGPRRRDIIELLDVVEEWISSDAIAADVAGLSSRAATLRRGRTTRRGSAYGA
jgi:DNA mismatch endonuclease (patch repair protein)